MTGITDGERKRLKSLGAQLRKAQREDRFVDAYRIERRINSLRDAIGLTDDES